MSEQDKAGASELEAKVAAMKKLGFNQSEIDKVLGIETKKAKIEAKRAKRADAKRVWAEQALAAGEITRSPIVDGDARATHRARMEALDALFGKDSSGRTFTQRTWIESLGKDAHGKFTKDYKAMVNTPWTYVSVPGDLKTFAFGNLTPEETAKKLWANGYGIAKSSGRFATDSQGKPSTSRKRGKGVAKQVFGTHNFKDSDKDAA